MSFEKLKEWWQNLTDLEKREAARRYDKTGERRFKFLKKKWSKFLYTMAGLTVVVFLLTFGCIIFNLNKIEVTDSGHGAKTVQRMAGTSLFLVDRMYEPKTHQAAFLFQIEREALYQKQPIELRVGERKTQVELPSEWIPISDEYGLVLIQDVPEDWRQFMIDIGETERFVDESVKVSTSYLLSPDGEKMIQEGDMKQVFFGFTKEETPQLKSVVANTKREYTRYFTERQIQGAEKRKEEYAQAAKQLAKDIDSLKKQQVSLTEDKKYQIEEKQKETDQRIESTTSKMVSYQEKIKELELGIQQLTRTQEKLRQWLQEN
ncbi:hypothetical protein EP56_01780 [Listeriaceae bacterium FSL A5-0209]|nr:hypothetical protein EP56_01780 [Listeriaceae bacterium FSL A5-0209]